MATTSRNALREIMMNPGSFSGSPGFRFAQDQAQQAITRRAGAAGTRGSGNVLAELARQATGAASQDYGNEVQRRLAAAGLEQEGDIAMDAHGIDRDRLALEGELGRGNLDLGRTRASNDFTLGTGRLALDDTLGKGRLALDTTRAGHDYELAGTGLDDAREGRWLDYDLGGRRQALAESTAENDFNLGSGRLDIDRFRAGTDRGAARSTDWLNRDTAARGWKPFGPAATTQYDDRRPAWARRY